MTDAVDPAPYGTSGAPVRRRTTVTADARPADRPHTTARSAAGPGRAPAARTSSLTDSGRCP
ncbi:hypothetical protein GCM10017688_42840 [Streptomyces ramulosus]